MGQLAGCAPTAVRAPALIIKAHIKLGIHLVAAANHAQVGVAVEHDAHLRSVHCTQTQTSQASSLYLT